MKKLISFIEKIFEIVTSIVIIIMCCVLMYNIITHNTLEAILNGVFLLLLKPEGEK